MVFKILQDLDSNMIDNPIKFIYRFLMKLDLFYKPIDRLKNMKQF